MWMQPRPCEAHRALRDWCLLTRMGKFVSISVFFYYGLLLFSVDLCLMPLHVYVEELFTLGAVVFT